MKITERELSKEIVKYLHNKRTYNQKTVMIVLNAMKYLIIQHVKSGNEVKLKSFGKFYLKVRKARFGVTPRNPSVMQAIPEIPVMQFKTSQVLKKIIKS